MRRAKLTQYGSPVGSIHREILLTDDLAAMRFYVFPREGQHPAAERIVAANEEEGFRALLLLEVIDDGWNLLFRNPSVHIQEAVARTSLVGRGIDERHLATRHDGKAGV